ncbi:MAG TPA: phosphoglycerate dehydrogenase [Thermoanaerobaculia bacterium]|nr:phosphoglycerate dehydrogenase [Thermoanaerobaculia bacterium]
MSHDRTLPQATSVLICDSLEQQGIDLLRAGGCRVDELQEADRPRLHEVIADYDAMIVRSATQVDAALLEHAKRLKVVGRAGIGVDNIDVKAATRRGVLVVNAPTANLLSATEHTFALLLAVARNLPAADRLLKAGIWNRKGLLGSELYGKTLGVIGFGQIGQRVAARARAFEMQVLAYDPFLSPDVARRLDVEPLDDLDAMIPRVDVLTFHTPLTDETRGILSRERIAKLRPGAIVVNCGRGGVIDEDALLEALESGHLAGAGLDVFAKEPPADFKLAAHPKVVASPHIGAQTREAQERIATEIARMVVDSLAGSLSVAAVNLPFRPAGSRGEPYLRLGEVLGRFASATRPGQLTRVCVDLWGIEESLGSLIAVAVLRGALQPFLGEAVNYVNAETVAAGRGIELIRTIHQQAREYSQLVGVSLCGDADEVKVAGTLHGDGEPRVVGIDDFRLEFRPEGLLLVMRNVDVPGVVGKLGTLLGAAKVNIADIHLARRDREGEALSVLRLDQRPPKECLDALRALPEARGVDVVDLR